MKEEDLETLKKLIDFILNQYIKLTDRWKNSTQEKIFNQMTSKVKNIDIKQLSIIYNYREFMNLNHIDIETFISSLNLNAKINERVKNQNSIEYKLERYKFEKKENGEVSINKCINDLYGIRIIFSNNIDYNSISKFIYENYGNKYVNCLKVIHGEYMAIHVYFKKDNNSFKWELQIWDAEHELSNLNSHRKYKQSYVEWEKNNKK